MKKAIVVIIISAVCVAVIWFAIPATLGVYRALFSPYLDSRLSGPLTVTPQWLEITPKVPLRVERQIQLIILDFAQPMVPDDRSRGVLLDNQPVEIEAELIDDYGNVFKL